MANSILTRQQGASTWDNFCEWVTSTNNRLYVGWFGVLMIPTLLAATICFITAFVAAPPSILMESVNPLLVLSCMETTSSLVPLFPPLMLSVYTSIPSGLASLDEWALQWWSLPTSCFPLPHRCLLLHGSRVGTLLPSRYASLDLRCILCTCCCRICCIPSLSLRSRFFL